MKNARLVSVLVATVFLSGCDLPNSPIKAVLEPPQQGGTITARVLSVSLQPLEFQNCDSEKRSGVDRHSFLIAQLDRQVTINYADRSYTGDKIILTFAESYLGTLVGGRVVQAIDFDDIAWNFQNETPQSWNYYVAVEVCLVEGLRPAINKFYLSNKNDGEQ